MVCEEDANLNLEKKRATYLPPLFNTMTGWGGGGRDQGWEVG